MKSLYILAFSFLLVFSCSKSNSGASKKSHDGTNYWKLVDYNWSIGTLAGTSKPSQDSSVELVLSADSTYISKLNGHTVCEGSYSITEVVSSWYSLQLHNFKPTGIFRMLDIPVFDSTGKPVSHTDGVFIGIQNDTMQLSDMPTPGSFDYYTFVKE